MIDISRKQRLASLIAIVVAAQAPAQERSPHLATADLKKLSIEELMKLEVTSVSRTTEPLGGAAAAITVVTGEDIHRSGAATIAEALRYVPGLHVARTTSNTWAIGSRGFSSASSEKLLVLADTRSLYTPLFSGVFWDAQDFLLADIERIEVIRGPGAALWGSNAVNGVINITTRRAQDTQGLRMEAGTGTEQPVLASARYGGQTATGMAYRVYGQYFDRDDSFHPQTSSPDDWHAGHVGFRSDWDRSDDDSFTLQGDLYRGTVGRLEPSVEIIGRPGPSGRLRVDVSGGNLLGRWQHRISDAAEIQLRAYYDHTHRDDPSYRDDLDTVDLDLQHRFAVAQRHEVTWGLNYHYTENRNRGKVIFALEPPSSQDQVASAFIQDQIALSETLRLTLGTKLEHNDFSGFEMQPSARAAWELIPGHTLWAAVSRAVRVPTRLERDIAIDVSDPAGDPIVRLLGNEDFDSEKLTAYELGYRWQANDQLSFDIATFQNRYRDLASLELGDAFLDPRDGRTVIPILNENLTDGRAYGLEALATFAPVSNWRLRATYSFYDLNLHPHGLDANRGQFLERSTPHHQFGLQSFLELPQGWQIDTHLRRLSAIRSIPAITTGEGLRGYTELDLRLAWHRGSQFEIALIGQNLLHEHHPEFGTPRGRGEVERGVLGKIVWRY